MPSQDLTGLATEAWSHQLEEDTHSLLLENSRNMWLSKLNEFLRSISEKRCIYEKGILVKLELTDPVLFSWVHIRMRQP